MRNSVRLAAMAFFAAVAACHAQIVTDETRTAVATPRGDTIVTTSQIVSMSRDITPRNSLVIVNPLKFFVFYNLTFMQKVSPGIAVGGGFQLPTVSGVDGWGVNAEVRFYPSGRAPRGFYVAPNIGYSDLTSGPASATPFSVGLLVGWQWFPGDDFALGLGIGVDYYSGSASVDHDSFTRFSGSVPALRFDIGYAW